MKSPPRAHRALSSEHQLKSPHRKFFDARTRAAAVGLAVLGAAVIVSAELHAQTQYPPAYPPSQSYPQYPQGAYPNQPYPSQQYPAPQYPQPQPYPAQQYPQQQSPQQSYPPPAYPQNQYPPGQPYPAYPQYGTGYPAQPYPPSPYYPGRYATAPFSRAPTPREGTSEQPPQREHVVTAIVSVLHPVAFSFFDASAEFRMSPHAGFSVVFGRGTASLRRFYNALPDEQVGVWEGGAQIRFYPIGSFDHGLQLGAEFVYLTGSASTTATIQYGSESYTGTVEASGTGFKAGPFIGYKLALSFGLSLMAQVGIDYLSLRGIAKGLNGESKIGNAQTAFPLADAGLGWSF